LRPQEALPERAFHHTTPNEVSSVATDEGESSRHRLSLVLADIVAMIIFSTALCMVIEIFIAGLSFWQSVSARVAAIPVNLVTGRPYGIFRDKLFQILHIDRVNSWKLILGDTLAFVAFQVPLYVVVLLLAEASWRQIAISSASITLIFSLAGRPYGMFLDFCRRIVSGFGS